MDKNTFTFKELQKASLKNRVLFDLILRDIINLKDIPVESRLIDKSLYIAALRNCRQIQGGRILAILKEDIELIEPCKYKEELQNLYDDWEKCYANLACVDV